MYSFSLGYAPNSNVLTANDNVNGNWTYGYDDFNRLVRADPSGQTYWYTYEYDRFGNRWHQSLGGTGGPPGNLVDLAFDANNRIVGSGVSYDAAGNVTNDGDSSYTYEAENRIISVSGSKGNGSYMYSAAGLRIRKTTPSGSVDYLYDLAGHVITEVNASGAWTRVEVYAGNRHIATYKDGPAGQTYFSHADWLGTERARTGMTGTTPVETCTSLPFGDSQSCTGTGVSPIHFTGKERDAESDNDYFGARYYISRHGRWLTPDWSARQEAVPYADLANPQTLNLYAYVGNNPVSHTDAEGHAQPTTIPGVGYWWKGETLVSVGPTPLDVTFASAGPQLMTESQEEQQEQFAQALKAPLNPDLVVYVDLTRAEGGQFKDAQVVRSTNTALSGPEASVTLHVATAKDLDAKLAPRFALELVERDVGGPEVSARSAKEIRTNQITDTLRAGWRGGSKSEQLVLVNGKRVQTVYKDPRGITHRTDRNILETTRTSVRWNGITLIQQ